MKIQEIQSVSIWSEGQLIQATKIGVDISYDNMVSSASFRYAMLNTDNNPDAPDKPINVGYIVIDGQDYINWGSTGDPNQEAIEYVCQKLNLVINTAIS